MAIEDIEVYLDASDYFLLPDYKGPFSSMSDIAKYNGIAGQKILDKQKLTAKESEYLLAANRDLRTIFDYPPMQIHRQSFDDRYEPIVGWEEYYRRHA